MAGQRQSGKASVPSSQFRRPILSVGAMSLLSKPKIAVDRRALLIGGGVGAGLLLAWSVWPREQSMNLAVREGETALGAFLKIGTDNSITVAVPQAEMGQGVWTVLPQILADALGANWSMVGVEPAPIGPAYANELLLRSWPEDARLLQATVGDRKSTRLNSSH